MHAVTERPQPRTETVGRKGFHTELDSRCELALAAHLTNPRTHSQPPWETATARLTLAADIITTHGMSTRHAAARQLVAGYLGVYDRYFRPGQPWRLTAAAPHAPLTWRRASGDVLVDITRTAPPSHPLADPSVYDRLEQLGQWAADSGVTLTGVRILSMSAPATSLLHDLKLGLTDLADTSFAPHLTTMAEVA